MRRTAGIFGLFILSLQVGIVFAATQPPAIELDRSTQVINGRTLLLNGIGFYKKFFFSVYKVALYVEDLSSDPAVILNPNEIKFARMYFQRDVSAKQIRDSWQLDFRTQCRERCAELMPLLKPLLDRVPDMKRGEAFEFTYLPDRFVIRKPGFDPIEVPGAEFGQFQLSTWLGDKAPSQSFRDGILGLD